MENNQKLMKNCNDRKKCKKVPKMTQNLLKLPKESTKSEKKLPQKVTQKVKMHQKEYLKSSFKRQKSYL